MKTEHIRHIRQLGLSRICIWRSIRIADYTSKHFNVPLLLGVDNSARSPNSRRDRQREFTHRLEYSTHKLNYLFCSLGDV